MYMKSQGVREDDPEFIKARNILAAASHRQRLMKERQQQQQQAQQSQMQQPPATNGQNATNGVNSIALSPRRQKFIANAPPGHVPSGSPMAAPTSRPTPPTTSATPDSQNANSAKQADGQQSQQVGPNSPYTQEQLSMLRSQIFAFKQLQKNLPIPPILQQQLFSAHQSKPPATPSQASTATPAPSAANPIASTSAQSMRNSYQLSETPLSKKQAEAVKKATKPIDPHIFTDILPLDQFRPMTYADHASRDRRFIIPALMPTGVDADRVREERERIVYNKMMSRKAELEQLPANLGGWDTSRSDEAQASDSIKLKAIIELKKLQLVEKQRRLRRQIHSDTIHFDNLAQTANRSAYRRSKKLSMNEARITEKLEKEQRVAREDKEKKKQKDFNAAIITHAAEIDQNAKMHKSRVQKLGRAMLQQHVAIEKEEQKRVERTAKQRLQALKNDDEETYLKLLGQAKDSRISHLLKQTDGFLGQLAASVKQQQQSASEQYSGANAPEMEESDSEVDEEGGPKVDYYQVAHRIKEEVTRQPDLLVGGTLKEYQVKGLQWMISLYNNNLNGLLADEMGLGKTIQTISLITYLIEKKAQHGPYLVIVPLSTLTNWNLEFEKWAPGVKRLVYKGPPNARKQQQYEWRQKGPFQVILTTYEYIIKDRNFLSRIKWVHMIVDEGHRMKNAQSKLSSTLTQYYQTRYRLILTGTPLQNNLPELWALLNFVLPTIFKSVKSFDEWFNTPFANTGGQDRMELSEEEQLLVIRRLHKVLRPFLLRRLKKDVEKDLPDKQERVVKCRFSALQAKLYKQLVTYNKMSVSDGRGGKTGMRGLSNMLMQLRKLCNHPFVFEQVEEQMNPEKTTNDLLWRTAGKFELLDRILPKFRVTGHRVLMFFQMTQIMNIMEDFMRLRGLSYLRLDGSTKSDDRSELLAQFNQQDSPYFCFLLSTRAGGLGLNLQTADTVIIFDSDWNPHQDLQAQDRAHRIGQKNEVRILRLISSNSVEEKILERANYKLDMDGKVIQAGKFDNKSTNEEREALLRTLLDTAEAAEQMAEQEEMDDDDLNQIMARTDDELIVFQKMDEERARDPDYGPDRELPRLMGESELPELYLNEENPVQEEIEELAGRGARERTRVKYDDGLTEEQWLQAVDDDEDTIEDAMARKNARIEKRNTNKEKRAKKGGAESSPDISRESSEAPQQKKRGRKSQGQKRKAEEDVDDAAASKRKRGKSTKAVDWLSASERAALQKVLNKTYTYLMDLTVEVSGESSDEEDGPMRRGLIEPFLKLVPRAHFADYYLIIKEPMAMDIIKRKINKEEYSSLKEFKDDVSLFCNNARTYNEDGSVLFQDANDIEVGFSDLGMMRRINADNFRPPVSQSSKMNHKATPRCATLTNRLRMGSRRPCRASARQWRRGRRPMEVQSSNLRSMATGILPWSTGRRLGCTARTTDKSRWIIRGHVLVPPRKRYTGWRSFAIPILGGGP